MGTIIALYPYKHPVRVDGELVGRANTTLAVPPGRHVVDLGQPVDYEPSERVVDVPEGGGLFSEARSTRSAFRFHLTPVFQAHGIGFRVLLPAPRAGGS